MRSINLSSSHPYSNQKSLYKLRYPFLPDSKWFFFSKKVCGWLLSPLQNYGDSIKEDSTTNLPLDQTDKLFWSFWLEVSILHYILFPSLSYYYILLDACFSIMATTMPHKQNFYKRKTFRSHRKGWGVEQVIHEIYTCRAKKCNVIVTWISDAYSFSVYFLVLNEMNRNCHMYLHIISI